MKFLCLFIILVSTLCLPSVSTKRRYPRSVIAHITTPTPTTPTTPRRCPSGQQLKYNVNRGRHTCQCRLLQSSYCKTGDSRVIFQPFNGMQILKMQESESIVCGLGELNILFQPYDLNEKLELREPVSALKVDCINESTIAFPFRSTNSSQETSANGDSVASYVEVLCTSRSPLTVNYYGTPPSTGYVLKSQFHYEVNQFVTQLYVPYRPGKTGKYTFRAIDWETGQQSEVSYFMFFKGTSSNIWGHDSPLPHNLNARLDTHEAKKILLPCRANDPSIKDVFIVSNGNANLSTDLETPDKFSYDPFKGFLVDKDRFDYVFSNAQRNDNGDRIVFCSSRHGSSIPVTVKSILTYYDFPSVQNILPENKVSWGFDTNKSFTTLTCKLKGSGNNDTLYVTSLYLSSVEDYNFLRPCVLKKINCKWNSFWLPEKKSLVHYRKQSSKYVRSCKVQNSGPSFASCQTSEIYKSGIARCSHELGEDYVEDMYFTALDEKMYFYRASNLISRTDLIRVVNAHLPDNEDKFYSSQRKTFSCTSVAFLVIPGYLWSIVYKDGTVRHSGSSSREEYLTFVPQKYIESLDVILHENITEIRCKAFIRAKLAREVQYIESSLAIDHHHHHHLKLDNTLNTLTPGEYMCFASNVGGYDYAHFHAEKEKPLTEPASVESESWLTGLSLSFIMVSILVIGFGCMGLLAFLRSKSSGILNQRDLDDFFKGPEEVSEDREWYDYVNVPYNKQKELSSKDFHIDFETVLGKGFFGKVYMGTVHGEDVAAKTVRQGIQREMLLALLAEIKIMSRLEVHPNIVSFVGANTKRLSSGEIFLFVEFCDGGSVESYLRGKSLSSTNASPDSTNENTISQIVLADWSLQASQGMEYLSSMKIIHGDLAIRNLLLKNMSIVKISDFGLAKQLQNYSIYTKKTSQPLPWRHMSPESLKDMKFSVKSDVWAFGVTLWEIFSLGRVPYAGSQWNAHFNAALEAGDRLKKPEGCLDDVYELMQKCWAVDPEERIDFIQLTSLLGQIKQSMCNIQIYFNPSAGCQ